MIRIEVALLNDQAEALARVLPEMLSALMAETALEETTPERTDDLTKTRAILGGVQSQVSKELRVIQHLREADRAEARKRARAAFSRGRVS